MIHDRESDPTARILTTAIHTEESIEDLGSIFCTHADPGICKCDSIFVVLDRYISTLFVVTDSVLDEIGGKDAEVSVTHASSNSGRDIECDIESACIDLGLTHSDDLIKHSANIDDLREIRGSNL